MIDPPLPPTTPTTPTAPASGRNGDTNIAKHVELLALDVDGVLTDGSVNLDDLGRELKRFTTRDGVGLRIWQALGFKAAVVTGRCGRALQYRMAELGVGEVIQGSRDKREAMEVLAARTGIGPERMAFLGDDWPDLPIMRAVAYPMAVADAEERVRAAAVYVTARPGGHGAVRDAVEHLLEAKGMLERAAALYERLPLPPG